MATLPKPDLGPVSAAPVCASCGRSSGHTLSCPQWRARSPWIVERAQVALTLALTLAVVAILTTEWGL